MDSQKTSKPERIKKKGFPVGRLGANVKGGINVTFTDFFREYNKTGSPRTGEAPIKP